MRSALPLRPGVLVGDAIHDAVGEGDKKLALRLESEKTDGERVYRIVAGKTRADTAVAPSA